MAEVTNRNKVREEISSGGWIIVWGDLLNEWDILTFAISVPTGTIGGWLTQQLQVQLLKFSQSLTDVSNEVIQQAREFLEHCLKKNKSGERDIGGLGVKAGFATYHRELVFSAFGRVYARMPLPNNHQPYIGLRVTKALPTTPGASPPVALARFTTNYGTAISGIGGYDLKSAADQAFAFDYDHSGKLDHIVLYRPGTGTIWILKNNSGSFSPVYAEGDPGQGIGGYDLRSPRDRAFAFDYDHSGKLDYIVLYRPGTGTMWILKNNSGSFSPVYAEGDPGQGIGGYDLRSPGDRALAFDFDHSGKLDHIVLYRPGTGTMWILKNNSGSFSPVYAEGDPGQGIGGYDLRSPGDRALAFDYDHSGKLDHIVLYRPGTGTMWVLKNSGGSFSSIYTEGDPGNGVAGFDLKSPIDKIIAFDYDEVAGANSLFLYRGGQGAAWITTPDV